MRRTKESVDQYTRDGIRSLQGDRSEMSSSTTTVPSWHMNRSNEFRFFYNRIIKNDRFFLKFLSLCKRISHIWMDVVYFINKSYEKSANLLSPTNIQLLHTQGMKDGTLVDSKYWASSENIRFTTLDPINMYELEIEIGEGHLDG